MPVSLSCSPLECAGRPRPSLPQHALPRRLERLSVKSGVRSPALSRRSLAVLGTVLGKPLPSAAREAAAAARRRTAIVTGASSGIGLAVAKALVALGWRVVPCCRSKRKLAATLEVLDSTDSPTKPSAEAVLSVCDLANLQAVSAFAADVKAQGMPIDALLLVAGIDGAPDSERTAQGIEPHFAVNHLGHFALCQGLLEPLRSAGSARVVSVTSSAAVDAELELDDLNWQRRSYVRKAAYASSKACNVLFTDELARREAAVQSGITANAVDPGPTVTQIVRYAMPARAAQRRTMTPEQLTRQARVLNFNTPEQGASGPLWLAASDAAIGQTGKWWIGPGLELPPSVQLSWRNSAVAKDLWNKSEDLVRNCLAA